MRIDFIITELPVGGAERCLTEVAIGLHRRGHAVRVVSLAPAPQAPRDLLTQRLQDAAVPFLSAGTASIYGAPQAFWRVQKMLRADKPDIVQTFLFHANVLGTAAAIHAGVPIRIGGVRVAQMDRWRLFLERRLIRKMRALTCVSRSVADFAEQYLAGPNTDIRVIPNAVDVSRFAAARPVDWRSFDLPQAAQVVLYVGRLDPQKGIGRLFAAAERFLVSNANCYLVLVGDGPERRRWVEHCQRMPGGRARVLPWQADVAPLLRGAALFALSSRYEGMPNVILEAMAAGLPVVCNEVEGAAELLTVQPARQLVPQGDTAALATAIEHLLSNPVESQRIGAANQAFVRQQHTIEAMLDRYEQLYAELYEQSSPSQRPQA